MWKWYRTLSMGTNGVCIHSIFAFYKHHFIWNLGFRRNLDDSKLLNALSCYYYFFFNKNETCHQTSGLGYWELIYYFARPHIEQRFMTVLTKISCVKHHNCSKEKRRVYILFLQGFARFGILFLTNAFVPPIVCCGESFMNSKGFITTFLVFCMSSSGTKLNRGNTWHTSLWRIHLVFSHCSAQWTPKNFHQSNYKKLAVNVNRASFSSNPSINHLLQSVINSHFIISTNLAWFISRSRSRSPPFLTVLLPHLLWPLKLNSSMEL